MVKLNQPGRMQRLVDMDQGTISREIFVNTDIYQQELEPASRTNVASTSVGRR